MTRTVRKNICATALVSVIVSTLGLGAAAQPTRAEKAGIVPGPGQKTTAKAPALPAAPANKAEVAKKVEVEKKAEVAKKVEVEKKVEVLNTVGSAKKIEVSKKAEPDKKIVDDKKTETDKKVVGAEKKTSTKPLTKVSTGKSRAGGGAHFVPPPPPNTPSMMADGDYSLYSGMPVEMLSKEALKDRAKELSIQYKDASRELEDRSREKDEKIQRAKEFEGLFQEGVVSRRELEASQREAGTVNNDIDRLTLKTNELKSLLDRINKRLLPKAAKKTAHKLIN